MTTLAPTTLAETHARENLARNLTAMDRAQPELRPWAMEQLLSVEWVFARDRSLSALDEFGRWIGGCSLPRRAADAALARLGIKGSVGCFLAPTHAAQIQSALDRLRPEQAVIAIVPDLREWTIMLHCADFSKDIESHRLWFASGPAWEVGLRSLLERHVGLATPSSFIRMPDAEPEMLEGMVSVAQQVFAEINNSRSAALAALRNGTLQGSADLDRLLVVAPSRFRLWNDLGDAMKRALADQSGMEPIYFDSDDPAGSSPLALLQAAQTCGALLSANTARTDLPGFIPETMPWITWITTARIPSSALAGLNDHLILADPALRSAALKAGWSESRIHIGGWPAMPAVTRTAASRIAVIADTVSTDTPKDLIEYSSHSLLWEAIRHDLSQDPARLNNPAEHLAAAMRRHGVGEDGFPQARFIESLIIPAWQHAMVRALARGGVPLLLAGRGWDALPDLADAAPQPADSRERLEALLSESAAAVHLWPTKRAHPVDVCGAAVIRTFGRSIRDIIADARAAIAGRPPPQPGTVPPLTGAMLRSILKSAKD